MSFVYGALKSLSVVALQGLRRVFSCTVSDREFQARGFCGLSSAFLWRPRPCTWNQGGQVGKRGCRAVSCTLNLLGAVVGKRIQNQVQETCTSPVTCPLDKDVLCPSALQSAFTLETQSARGPCPREVYLPHFSF